MTPNQTLGGGALSVADVLERAAELIEPEGAWTQGWSARTADGVVCYSLASQAARWCIGGAIVKANGADDELAIRAFTVLDGVIVGEVSRWNDAPERTQAEAVAKLREAAALAREQSR